MEVTTNEARLVLVQGDITKETTDAIVNAANEHLTGGGGVDGAIHRAGGPSIMAECRKIGHCPTGKAVITTGGGLKAKYIIHTVGPRYFDGSKGEARLLQSAYYESLKLASTRHITSIAFPAISTGAYGYPPQEAAQIALNTTNNYLKQHPEIILLRFVLYDKTMYDVFSNELEGFLKRK
jgi:O-acetyl-ADP-ribose deacetylase (regulator of RNase III)